MIRNINLIVKFIIEYRLDIGIKMPLNRDYLRKAEHTVTAADFCRSD